MAKGYLDYIAENGPAADPADDPAAAATIKQYEELTATEEEAARLKESIDRQIEDGSPLHHVLISAIEAIGILTKDPTWRDKQLTALEEIYPRIVQESLFVDNAALSAARLEERREEYLQKVKKRLQNDINKLTDLQRDYTRLYEKVTGNMEGSDEK